MRGDIYGKVGPRSEGLAAWGSLGEEDSLIGHAAFPCQAQSIRVMSSLIRRSLVFMPRIDVVSGE
jgi:hypothetical protein